MQIYKYKYLPTYLPIEYKNIKTISGMQWISTLLFYSFCFQITYLTVVEWKDCHFLAVATVSDLQNSYCNQWPHPYEPQISNRFVFSAICLHFTAVLVKFSEKTSAIKTKSPQTKWPYQGV